MLIPKIFYGSYKSVSAESRKVAKRLVKGESLVAACAAEAALENLETGDEIMLEHPYPGEGATPAFYMEPLGMMMGENIGFDPRLSPQRERTLFLEFLEYPWSLATVIGRNNAQFWLDDVRSKVDFLEAVERHRPVLDTAGVCFVGGTHGEPRVWWNFPHGVGYALANLGVSLEAAREFGHTGIMPDWRLVAPQLESVG